MDGRVTTTMMMLMMMCFSLPALCGADHKASVGFGGSCFQKDILNLVYLCS
jgi:hypothetical protein